MDRRASLETAIQTGIDSSLKDLHTCLPGEVISFNPAEQTADIQPSIKRLLNGKLVNLPVLKAVPIRYQRSSDFSITFPLVVGDHVLLIFCERSIDTWLEQGGIKGPDDIRRHSLSDAFALPMMYGQPDKITDFDADNLEIKSSGGTSVKLTPSGNIELNGNSDFVTAFTDMKVAFDQLVSDFNLHTHGGVQSGASSTLIPIPSTADMSGAKVDTIKVP